MTVQVGADCIPSCWYMYHFWPVQCRLDITSIVLRHEAAQALISCSLPDLHQLSLTTCLITSSAAAELARGSWPNLQSLDLPNSFLSPKALQTMLEGELPLLRRLNISHILQTADNSTCDLDDQLGSAYWPQLEEVVAVGWRHVCLSTVLRDFRCPKLKSLHVSHLRWEPDLAFTSLQHLSLLEDDDPSCLSLLLSLHLPMLQSLHIQAASTSTLLCGDGRFAQMVIKGKWPQLQSLKLFGHHLDHASVAMLPRADWHCLRWLTFH